MITNKRTILISFFALIFIILTAFLINKISKEEDLCINYIADANNVITKLYWKDEKSIPFKNIGNLKSWLEKNNEKLVFAMNGGMYKKNNIPQGLYIEDGKILNKLDTLNGDGNFYMHPNGVFYIDRNNHSFIEPRAVFAQGENIKYATQSGPMLVVNGIINPLFTKNSKNLNIRNGVGILPNQKVLFAMSKKEISFYDFAKYFKNKGCSNALYLDGFVSRTYAPQQNFIQTDGDFGVIIAITSK